MSDENKDFKVVDRRFSKDKEESPKDSATSGEGFVMKEKPEPEDEASPQSIDFSTLIFSLATGALINMGLAPDPVTRQTQKNLELAKQNIDILCLLQAKTKGNLTPDEAKLLENLVAETQLRYVEASRR